MCQSYLHKVHLRCDLQEGTHGKVPRQAQHHWRQEAAEPAETREGEAEDNFVKSHKGRSTTRSKRELKGSDYLKGNQCETEDFEKLDYWNANQSFFPTTLDTPHNYLILPDPSPQPIFGGNLAYTAAEHKRVNILNTRFFLAES